MTTNNTIDVSKIDKLIDLIDEDDDVQNVYTDLE